MIGSVHWLKLLGAHEARKDTHSKVDEITGDWKEAQKTAGEREEAFDEAMDAVEAASSKRADEEAAISAGKDLRRAQRKVEELDRKRRKLVDLDKKLNLRVYQILDELTGEGGNLQYDTKPDPLAWSKVELADILGEMHAYPFIKAGLRTVGDAKAQIEDDALIGLVKGGDLNKHQAKWLTVQVVANLNRRGVKHEIEIPKGAVEVPDEVKPEAPAPKLVPCLGGTYKFTSEDREFDGAVQGGSAKVCRVELYTVRRGDGKRGEVIEVDWNEFELEEIDVPKDALRVDQPQGGAAGEMGGKTKAA